MVNSKGIYLPQFSRTKLLIGERGLACLQKSRVIVFGVGGVGSYAVEALARTGIGNLVLVDFDQIEITNINRQLPALLSTIGDYKVDLLRTRIKEINPEAQVTVFKSKVTPDNVQKFFSGEISYVLEAIDQVSAKAAIIETAFHLGIPIISAMGMGNRLEPTKLKISRLNETSGCPLARVMRRKLKQKGISPDLKVVYSQELPPKNRNKTQEQIIGSISFVPAVAGFLLASEVVQDLLRFVNS